MSPPRPISGLTRSQTAQLPRLEARRLTSASLAAYAHYATLAGAFATWAWLDRKLWFFGDEWSFLTQKGLFYAPADPRSIWYPHNEHWSTLPILLWRALYNLWHLGSYWPYLVPLLLAHLAVMHLAWRACRRAHVEPWVATAAVALLGWLGAGAEDLAWAFQVGFVGSVAFGYLAVDLLDRPVGDSGAIGSAWRGGLASASLLASLMCSTIGDALFVAGALVALARLPRKRAAQVLAFPLGSYVVWFAFVGRLGTRPDRLAATTTLTGIPNYIWTGLSASLGQAFNLEAAGAGLLVGVAAWVLWNSRALWLDSPALIGLAAASVAFFLLVGLGRDDLGSAIPARYIYVAIALLLPALARLLSSVSSWAPARVAVLAFCGVALLGNLGQARSWVDSRDKLVDSLKTESLAAARLLARGVRDVAGPSAMPLRFEPNLTAGWLASAGMRNLLPQESLSTVDLVNARVLLSTALTAKPLAQAGLQLLGTSYAKASPAGHGCTLFAPEVTSPPMEIWVGLLSGEKEGSVRLTASPAARGTVNYLALVMVPAKGPPSSAPAELAMKATGTGFLDYNGTGARLALLWDEGTPLRVCRLRVTAKV